MTWSEIALICVSVVLVMLIIAIIAINVIRRKDKHEGKKTDELEVIDGVRYTKDDVVVDESGKASVTLKKGDIMLERGKEYLVGENGDLLAGKYTVLTADENSESVNIRIGGLVRDYKHFSSIVLTDGDKISPVSNNVVLR